jgi:D-alanyl-D-alanine carboxypeptidase (penicillin-binding protein 5/6)
MVAAVAIGAAFAVVTPAGQPADEPSYYSTLRHYATEYTMPTLGDPGVSYEAQMGPVYYVLAAPIDRIAAAFGGEKAGFLAVRLADLLLFVPLVLLTWALVREVLPKWPLIGLAATAFVALHPSILTIAASVQTDFLSIVLSLWAILLAVRALRRDTLTARTAVGIGLIIAAAGLTKQNALFLVPTVVLTALLVRGRISARWLAVMCATVVAATAWFFVRNVVLYGDISGRAGVEKAGFDFAPGKDAGLAAFTGWIRLIASHFSIPYEYLRQGTPSRYAFVPPPTRAPCLR